MSECLSLNFFFLIIYTLLHHNCDKKNGVIVVLDFFFFFCLVCNSIAGLYYLHTIYLIKILIIVFQHI